MSDERDRRRFLELLAEAAERFVLRWHAYVLLDNHYHLLVETARANLSVAMRYATRVHPCNVALCFA